MGAEVGYVGMMDDSKTRGLRFKSCNKLFEKTPCLCCWKQGTFTSMLSWIMMPLPSSPL